MGIKLTQWVQAERIARLQKAYRHSQIAHPREDMPTPDQIRSLGLLDRAQDTDKVLAASRKGS